MSEDITTTDQTVTDQTVTDQTVTDQTVTDQTVTDQTVTDQTVTDQTVTDPTVTDQTVTDQTVTDQTVTVSQIVESIYTQGEYLQYYGNGVGLEVCFIAKNFTDSTCVIFANDTRTGILVTIGLNFDICPDDADLFRKWVGHNFRVYLHVGESPIFEEIR